MPNTDARLLRVSRVLNTLSGGVSTVAGLLPGTPGIVGSAVAAALSFAADVAEVGLDPVQTIERAKEADDALAEMRRRWAVRRGRPK